jgi:hypothetical protein
MYVHRCKRIIYGREKSMEEECHRRPTLTEMLMDENVASNKSFRNCLTLQVKAL